MNITLNYNAGNKSKKKNNMMKLADDFKKSIWLQLLILPGLAYFIIFQYIPIYGLTIAFKDYNIKKGILGSSWIGLDQFMRFMSHPDFLVLIKNTVILSAYGILFGFLPPIILAVLLNEPISILYRKFVQTVSYLPYFISTVAIVGILYLILSPKNGLVNDMVKLMGGSPIYFIMEPKWFRTIFTASGIWQTLGFNSIVYLSSLSGINPELYESATIDGANRFQKILYITIPSIQPTIIIMLIFAIGGMMSINTDKALLLQQPATYVVSDVLGTYAYRRGLVNFEYSYGAAVGLFNSLVNVILLVFANKMARKFTDTSLF